MKTRYRTHHVRGLFKSKTVLVLQVEKQFRDWFDGDVADVQPSLRGSPKWVDATVEDLQEILRQCPASS